jgi:hypothetical protein
MGTASGRVGSLTVSSVTVSQGAVQAKACDPCRLLWQVKEFGGWGAPTVLAAKPVNSFTCRTRRQGSYIRP